MKLDNFFTSGWIFDELQRELKSKYQIVNIIIISYIVGLFYGIIGNIIRDIKGFVLIESILLLGGVVMLYYLRKSQN
ncbi:MAG: two-component sensor histidine kinase, partial [Campylobacterota bacterium]|nr:two-component sensor histidine kinase [Campylobacterota bacterium]